MPEAAGTETVEKPTTSAPPASAGQPGEAAKTNGAVTNGAATEGTLLDGTDDAGTGNDTAESKVQTPANWPEDWRARMAGGDEKKLKRLERMATPDKVLDSYLALEQKVSSGEYKKETPFPEKGTPEEQAKWYEERGLPKEPTGYVTPKVLEPFIESDDDKAALGQFYQRMHKAQAPQKLVDQAIEYVAEMQAASAEKERMAAKAYLAEAEDKLRADFGNEYRGSMNLYKRVLTDPEVFPGEAGTWLQNATVNGQRLINNPDFAKAMVAMGLERYGAGGMITGDAAKAMASEEETARKYMKTDWNKYISEGWDKKLAAIMEKKGGRSSVTD